MVVSMQEREHMPYRDCVSILLFNDRGQVFVARRNDPLPGADAHLWQVPQGGIDKGEAPIKAALRELFEETSVRSADFLYELDDWLSYDLPDDLLGVAFKGKYRGQRQRWFAFRFTGSDEEINISEPGEGHRPEFDAWRWEDLLALPALVVLFKRGVYEAAVAGFGHLPQQVRDSVGGTT